MKRRNDAIPLTTAGRPADLRAWSRCEYHLLKLLTSGPFLPTKKQICRPGLRGPFSTTAMRNAVNRLRQDGWLQRYSIEVHAPSLLEQPLLTCQPGQACPDFRRIKTQLKQQDEQRGEWKHLQVHLPSRQAANLFGSPYFGIESAEPHAYRTGVSHVVSLISTQPVPTSIEWIWSKQQNSQPYERTLGIRLETSGGLARVIGVIRAQSCKTLVRLHAHCSAHDWPIELW